MEKNKTEKQLSSLCIHEQSPSFAFASAKTKALERIKLFKQFPLPQSSNFQNRNEYKFLNKKSNLLGLLPKMS